MTYKVLEVVDALLLKAKEMGIQLNHTQVQKLLYFSQGYSLAINGESIFSNEIEAWDMGPVVPKFYYYDTTIECQPVEPKHQSTCLAPAALAILALVLAKFGNCSATKLVDLTHQHGSPWHSVYIPGVKKIKIPVETMKVYFAKQLNPDDVLKFLEQPLSCDESETAALRRHMEEAEIPNVHLVEFLQSRPSAAYLESRATELAKIYS